MTNRLASLYYTCSYVCGFFFIPKFSQYFGVFQCYDVYGFMKFCSGVFIDRKYYYLALGKSVDNQFDPDNRFVVLCSCYSELNAME